MNLQSGKRRVQSAVLLYLLVFFGMNLYVWTWFVVHRHGPHNFPLGERVERYGDLLRFSGKFQYWKDPHMVDSEHLIGTLFPANYPPFSVIVYLFLLQVCAPYALAALMAPVLGAIAIACAAVWKKVRRFDGYRWYMGVGIFATGLFGWGTEQIVMRGNIEGVMWVFVCIGAALYAKRRYNGAAAAFGIACCVKPYPVLWLFLMARHRKYRAVVAGLLTAAAVTLGSLLIINPNPIRAYAMTTGKSNFFENYIVAFRPMNEMKGDHSLLQTMKTLARVVRNHGIHFRYYEYMSHPNDPLARELYYAYLPLAAVIGLVVLWKVWNKPVLNQIFALACITMVLPMVAGDYTLSLILVPMGFFLIFLMQDVAQERTQMSLVKMLWFLLPCAWITATDPLNVLHGVFKCFALLLLLGASVAIPLPSTLFGELTD